LGNYLAIVALLEPAADLLRRKAESLSLVTSAATEL
jgi:hypothetical protein